MMKRRSARNGEGHKLASQRTSDVRHAVVGRGIFSGAVVGRDAAGGRMLRRFSTIVFAAFGVACGRSSPMASTATPDISGTWSGTISSAKTGNTTLLFTLVQGAPLIDLSPSHGVDPNVAIGGTWSRTFTELATTTGGTLNGFVTSLCATADSGAVTAAKR